MWSVSLQKPALKNVARAPKPERARLFAAIERMHAEPTAGDCLELAKQPVRAYRRRVGNWRIFFDLYPERHLAVVTAIERRTTTTYRKRR
jgi:mRNA-degrading endonuclease RelE of RelBE toxin-antitoxin system